VRIGREEAEKEARIAGHNPGATAAQEFSRVYATRTEFSKHWIAKPPLDRFEWAIFCSVWIVRIADCFAAIHV